MRTLRLKMKSYVSFGSSRRYTAVFMLSILITMGFVTTNIFSTSRTYESRIVYEGNTSAKCIHLPDWQTQLLHVANRNSLAAGRKFNSTKHLILGIASVYRKENYLRRTLSSLIQESNEEERRDAVIVVYLADANPQNNQNQLALIQRDFHQYIESGFIHVLVAEGDIYPSLEFASTKRTFNDSLDRVRWRAKQVIDFSFLLAYAQPLGDYYLVVEDDVVATNEYITAIRDFISSRKDKRWVALQFTGFLGIGLLFRSKDLSKLNQFLWMFYQDQPVDMLMREFINMQIPDSNVIVRRIPSLFQHIGVQSTLPNKVQKLTDNTFNMANRKFKRRNPTADLVTSMKVYNDFVPEYAYRSTPGFFWGIAKTNDTVDIVFPTPISITRIVVITGIVEPKQKFKDQLKDGVLEIGSNFQKMVNNNVAVCDNFLTVKAFKDGNVDYNKKIESAQCIRVRVGSGQKSWVIIREIEVFV